jgi:hypothetical protein
MVLQRESQRLASYSKGTIASTKLMTLTARQEKYGAASRNAESANPTVLKADDQRAAVICLFLPFECAFTAMCALGIGPHRSNLQHCQVRCRAAAKRPTH